MAYQSPFAPAQIDFSGIGKLADSYYGAQNDTLKRQAFQEDRALQAAERQRQESARNAISQSFKSGDPDFRLMAQAVAPYDPAQATELFKLHQGQQPKPTDDQREYLLARQQGFGGSFMDYQTAMKRAGATQTNIDMKEETSYDKKLGEELATEFVKANQNAASAQRSLANLDVMKQALADPNLYTGTGGNVIQSVKKGAETLFGVPVKGTSSGEIMQNLASEIAVSNKDKLPGPMSDADRQFLVDMAPNLSKTPEGNRLIIELGMEHKRWEVARGLAARQYAAKNNGRLDAGFYATVGDLDNQAGQKFSTILTQLRGMGTMAPRSPAAGVPDAYKSKYGLE